MEELTIESLDGQARGLAHRAGKTVFVEGALPGERVTVATLRGGARHDVARIDELRHASSQRVEPRCASFGVCGGCVMQHLEPAAQVAVKQRLLEDAFARVALKPRRILPPLQGLAWGYRHRARLKVHVLPGAGRVIIGFHQRNSSYIADIQACHVLPARVAGLLAPLRALVAGMSAPDRIPQIEVAVGDAAIALVLRHLTPLLGRDLDRLREFGRRHAIVWWLQAGGPQTAMPLDQEDADALAYGLPEFGLRIAYRPTDFTQVNPLVNRALVSRAVALLDAQPGDRVADLFCGLGNFTLPLATRARAVVGIEASAALIERARKAAAAHGLDGRVRFEARNLFELDAQGLRSMGRYDRMLMDPPREGARAVAEALARLDSWERPARIVYVSCNPLTLARDAAILVHTGRYRLGSAGVINMFMHTAHVESIAVFDHGGPGGGEGADNRMPRGIA